VQLIDSILGGLRNTSAPEAVSVVLGLLYSILAVRRTRWCWVAGGISSAILVVLAWQAKLPMQACLQGYYVGMSVYGFWHWSKDEGATRPVTTWPFRAHLIAWVAILALSALTSRYLAAGTQAAWPFLDSLTT
jgi:nicotinamide mononucleotide transporter